MTYLAEIRKVIMYTKIRRFTMSILQVANIAFFLAMLFSPIYADKLSEKLKTIKLPPGFHINIYASGIKGARSLAIGQHGTIFVGSRSEGKVYALQDNNGDFRADRRFVIASGLNIQMVLLSETVRFMSLKLTVFCALTLSKAGSITRPLM